MTDHDPKAGGLRLAFLRLLVLVAGWFYPLVYPLYLFNEILAGLIEEEQTHPLSRDPAWASKLAHPPVTFESGSVQGESPGHALP